MSLPQNGKLRFREVAMIKPTKACIYAPSRINPEVIEKELTGDLYESARVIRVSFEPDGVSDPQPRVAYADGLDCWYILADR